VAEMERVLVTVRGTQTDETGEESVIETTAAGRYYLRGGKHYVLYEDGAEARTSTVLKFNEHKLTLLRHGAIEHRQEFLPQGKSRSFYRTPVGELELEVHTHKLAVDFGAVAGKVDVLYDLAVNGRLQSRNSLHIEVAACSENQAD